MADRIQTDLKVDPEFQRLLDESRARVASMTDEEVEAMLREQRISFVYGNLALHDPNVTKDDIRRAAERMQLLDKETR